MIVWFSYVLGYGSAVFKQGDDVDQHEDHYQYRTNRMTDLLVMVVY